jgi:hypothetical protein
MKNSNLKDGQPCAHPGCLQHLTHPCEGCGRVGGKHIMSGVQGTLYINGEKVGIVNGITICENKTYDNLPIQDFSHVETYPTNFSIEGKCELFNLDAINNEDLSIVSKNRNFKPKNPDECPFCDKGIINYGPNLDIDSTGDDVTCTCDMCHGTGLFTEVEFTCKNCTDSKACPCAFDMYCTNGDCLMK